MMAALPESETESPNTNSSEYAPTVPAFAGSTNAVAIDARKYFIIPPQVIDEKCLTCFPQGHASIFSIAYVPSLFQNQAMATPGRKPIAPAPGRAARSNRVGRFEAQQREVVDDGWDLADDIPPLRTEVSTERPRQVITRNSSPDISFDRSINPYRGCEHGCIYCFARPTHAFLGLSPGLDFETRLIARPEAPAVLERELRSKSYRPATIAIGTNTDPYQPIEREYRIMRRILEVLLAYRHPVAVVTKGTLVERDIDILSEMAAQGLARVGISVTTLDPELSRRMAGPSLTIWLCVAAVAVYVVWAAFAWIDEMVLRMGLEIALPDRVRRYRERIEAHRAALDLLG